VSHGQNLLIAHKRSAKQRKAFFEVALLGTGIGDFCLRVWRATGYISKYQ